LGSLSINGGVAVTDEGSGDGDISCPPGNFECVTGNYECIPEEYRCDDYPDCRDGSDELGCGDMSARGVSPGESIGLNLKSPLYIGGVDPLVRVNKDVGTENGFVGCISEISIRGIPLNITNSVIKSYGVSECVENQPCRRQPCKNNGVCRNGLEGEYECSCTEDYTGINCEIYKDECYLNNPCKNDGICSTINNVASCSCPIGFVGKTCSRTARIRRSIEFEEDGYVELSSDLVKHNDAQIIEEYTFTISTFNADGLIFWQGQLPKINGKGKDFIALAVENGQLVFSYELGSGPANITWSEKINDGQQHTIVATRTGRIGTLQVDRYNRIEGSSKGVLRDLNVPGNIFIGGMPNSEVGTGGLFNIGFSGCIKDVTIQQNSRINFQSLSKSGYNVKPC